MSFVAGLRHALDLRQRDVVSELKRGDSLEDILNRHLLTVEQMSDIEILTSVLLLSSDGKHLAHGAAPSLPQAYREVIDGSEIGPSAGSCGTAAYLGRPVYVTDIATDPLWAAYRHLALPHGLRSCWSTPIRHAGGELMGTFAIYHRNVSGPARDELNAIDIITDNVAQAIAWARDPTARMHASDVLPRQVAALEALAAAISEQSSALDDEGQRTIEAIVKESHKLAKIVRRHLAEPEETQG
jgi:GAF domain-containing protein